MNLADMRHSYCQSKNLEPQTAMYIRQTQYLYNLTMYSYNFTTPYCWVYICPVLNKAYTSRVGQVQVQVQVRLFDSNIQ